MDEKKYYISSSISYQDEITLDSLNVCHVVSEIVHRYCSLGIFYWFSQKLLESEAKKYLTREIFF